MTLPVLRNLLVIFYNKIFFNSNVLGIVEYFESGEEVKMMKGGGGASTCGGFSENV